mgnify:FL=1
MKKTLLIALLSLLISMVLAGSTTLAEESISPMIQPGDTAVMWVIKSKTSIGDTNGSGWELKYTGYPASQAGETDSVSITQAYNSSITGTFGVSLGKIEASVGFSSGTEYSFSISKTSRALKKNEYIKASTRKYYTKYTVNQEKQQMVVKVRYDSNGNPILYTETTVIATAKAYAYKPQSPQIKLDYYIGSGAKIMSGADVLTRSEIFALNDQNRWVRVK